MAGGKKHVVVGVDDDFRVRESVERLVESAGYAHLVFSSAEEFLGSGTLAAATCVITDVRMPGKMDGLALAREVHDRWPHIGIMVVSGQSIPGTHRLPAGCRFLRKPYCPEAAVKHAHEMTA